MTNYIERYIRTIIDDWVRDNLGESEAKEPSWNIDLLAKHIGEHAGTIHSLKQEEYDVEDIEMVADEIGIELNDGEKNLVLHRFKHIEDTNLDTLKYIIEELKGE